MCQSQQAAGGGEWLDIWPVGIVSREDLQEKGKRHPKTEEGDGCAMKKKEKGRTQGEEMRCDEKKTSLCV